MPELGYQRLGLATWGDFIDDYEESNPDLVFPLFIDVFDRMRREDPQVGSVLRAVTLPIRSAAWSIDPAGARREVAQHVAKDLGLAIKGEKPERVLRTRGRFSFPEHLRLSLLSLTYGASYFEQVYDTTSERGRAHLHKLAWRPPRTIAEIKVAPDGGLVAIVQHGRPGDTRDIVIGVDRLVAYVNDREGGNWLGQSLLRTAYKMWLLKDRVLRSQALTIERNGLGVPIYEGAPLPKDGENMSAEERAAWLASERDNGLIVAKGFRAGETAGASLTPGAKLRLAGVDGRLPDTDKPIRYFDEQIARAVLAHFLNLGTETGSWALGSTFANFFTDSLNAVADSVCDTMNQHVVEDLVDENWGPQEPAPRLVFDRIGAEYPATAEAIKLLIESKAIQPDEDLEAFMRQAYRLPVANPETRIEIPEPAPPQPPAPAEPDDDEESDDEAA